MAKHTPGPWRPTPHNEICISSEARAVAVICYAKQPTPEDHANARLIAAAPDLLEVAKRAEEVIEFLLSYYGYDEGVLLLKDTRAAIAKAEG